MADGVLGAMADGVATARADSGAHAERDTVRSQHVTTPEPSVDDQHPWLGLASFTEETRSYFFGRDEEVAELARRVQRKTLTLLFGQSGLGKTSILRAGIVPRLRPNGYCPVYVRIDYSRESPAPAEQIKDAIFRATQESGQWTQPGVAETGESLWEFLHHRDDILRDGSGRTLIPLLIFDQFEEIFTLAQSDDFGRRRAAQFLEDLADLVENRPPKALEARIDHDEAAAERFDFARSDYRILIALREDYLAHLEALKSAMPSITQNRMRLARMTGEQALSAVLKPGGKLVSQEVAESIVRFIAGGSELRNAEVEPSLLSLICRELNNARIAQGRTEISADLLAGSHDTILAEFYERALADQPPAVRQFIEDELLTESGFRESLAEERVRKACAAVGAAPDALAKLVDRRLLRIEERLDVRRVELTHDVLCGIVRASRDLRHEREARDEAERKLAAQRERERATRKALVRARQVAAVCGVLAVGALASAIFGYESTKRAQRAEVQAQETRQLAESARGEAEKLIVYLLDDFYLELEPVGRLDIVGQLSKRALDYYDALPPALRSDETNRNRALALVRYGAVLRTQSKLEDSEKALTEAVEVLGKLRAGGDRSELTAIGLAVGLMSKARVLDSLNQQHQAKKAAGEAVDVLKPLMTDQGSSVALRRAYGAVLNYFGFSQLRTAQEELAVNTLEQAREAYRSIDGLKLTDLPAAAAFTESSAWQMEALQARGRTADVKQVGEEALRIADRILEARPGHMGAIRSRALISGGMTDAEGEDFHLAKALAFSDQQIRGWETMLKLDPSNGIAWNNLAASNGGRMFLFLRLGRISEAKEAARAALDIERRTSIPGSMASNLAFPAGILANIEADLGNRRLAEAALADSQRLVQLGVRNLPPVSFTRSALEGFASRFLVSIPVAAADYQAAHSIARGSLARIDRIRVDDDQQKQFKNILLVQTYKDLSQASYYLGNYAVAREESELEDRVRAALPPNLTLQDRRDESDSRMLAAMIAARQGRLADARQIVEPVLKFHRELYARNDEDVTQFVQMARALYVAALAGSAQRTAQLKEAASIVDRLPPQTKQRISVQRLREWIVEEQQKGR